MQELLMFHFVSHTLRVGMLQAVRASHSTIKSGSPMARREVLQSAQFLDKECLQGIAKGFESKSLSGSCVFGLDALQSLVSSPLCIALDQHAEASQAAEYKWLLCSCLDSADTLPGNIMRRVSCVLQEVMVKSMELDLLKSESCASQAPQWKARKESRRKKNRISGHNNGKTNSGNEVVEALLLSEVCFFCFIIRQALFRPFLLLHEF